MPHDSMQVHSKSNMIKSLPRTMHKWLPKLQSLAEPVAKCFPRIVQICLWIIDSGCSKHMTGNRALLAIEMKDKMSRDVITVGSTMRIPLLYRATIWDALERHMRGSEYGEQDRKAAILYELINDLKKCGYKKDNCELNYKFLNNLQPEWKQYGEVNDALGYKKKAVVVTSDPLALLVEKTKVSKRKEKVKVQTKSEGSDDEDISDLKKITALLAKAFNRKKYYAKPTNNNLRTSSASSSANKKPDLEPGLSNLNETGKSSNRSVSKVDEASKKDLEDLFQKFYDEYFDSSKIMKSSTTNVENPINDEIFHEIMKSSTTNVKTPIIEEVFHEVSESFQGEASSSSLNDDVQQSPKEDLEDLFQKNFDKYFGSSKIMKSSTMNVETSNVKTPSNEEEVFHESSESFQEESSSSSLNDDVQQSLKEVRVSSSNTQSILNNMILMLMKQIVQIYLWIIDSGCSKHMT
nr:hypothetical protein [Tanacetum cinerariifolium]